MISLPEVLNVWFNSLPLTPEIISRIAEKPGKIIRAEIHTYHFPFNHEASKTGSITVEAKSARYSARAKVGPKRTASVSLPAFLSVGSSRKLLTTRRAVANNPGPKPA